MSAAITVDSAALREEVKKKYRDVANKPSATYHFHTGRPLAARLGYDAKVVGAMPDAAVESFAGVANPFSLRRLQPGERVVDLGSGAGFDCFVAANEVGAQARARLKRLSDEIQELDTQRLKIEIDILNAQKGQLQQELQSEQETKPNVQNARNIVVDDEHEYWPFNGEYWKDELGYYRVRVQSQCKR